MAGVELINNQAPALTLEANTSSLGASSTEMNIKSPKGPTVVQSKFEVNQKSMISEEELETAIKELNEALKSRDSTVSFSVDEALGKDVVSVFNDRTGELIRQLPHKEVLTASRNIDRMIGILFDQAT